MSAEWILSRLRVADGKLKAELREAGDRYPRIKSAFRWVLVRRLGVIMFLATVRGALDGLGFQYSDDPTIFSAAAERLFSTGWANLFADNRVQVGPVAVAFFYPVRVLSGWLDVPVTFVLALISTVVFTGACMMTLRYLSRSQLAPGKELFFGLVVVLGGVSWSAATSGHPEEGFIGLLWLIAARDALHGRSYLSGVWLGLAGALKLSGLLGIPILLLTPQFRRAGKALTLTATIVAVAYLPFILFGDTRTFDFLWEIRPHSPLVLIFGAGEVFTWTLRIVQAGLVAGTGIGIALLFRSDPKGIWAVPLGILTVRLLTDPLDYHYYWLPIGTILLVAWVQRLPSGVSWWGLPVAASFYAALLPFFLLSGKVLAWVLVGMSLAMIAGILKSLSGVRPLWKYQEITYLVRTSDPG